jgi:hypothetical protein
MFGRYQIEGNYQPQAGLNEIFGKMNEILNIHAPEERKEYSPRGLHPMISPDQAARELLELLKGETNNN